MEINLLATPDFVRSVLISTAALLFGFVLFASYQTWRDRKEALPVRKVPAPAVGIFTLGYLSLLAHTAWCRWEAMGTGHITTGTWLTIIAMACNVFGVGLILYYKRDENTPSLSEMRATDPGIVGAILRWKIFKNVLDDKRYGAFHGDSHHPGRRAYDRMTPKEMIVEVERFVEEDDGAI